MKTLMCPICVMRGEQEQYSIKVDHSGNLSIICEAHNINGEPFAYFKNEEIADNLQDIGGTPCDHCGDKHGKDDPVH